MHTTDNFGFITNALLSRWHWRAFLTGGGNAIWLLAYGLFYWASRLSLDSFSSVALYMGYLFLLVLLDFLVTGQPPSSAFLGKYLIAFTSFDRSGTIGFLATYWAVRKLYGSIRID